MHHKRSILLFLCIALWLGILPWTRGQDSAMTFNLATGIVSAPVHSSLGNQKLTFNQPIYSGNVQTYTLNVTGISALNDPSNTVGQFLSIESGGWSVYAKTLQIGSASDDYFYVVSGNYGSVNSSLPIYGHDAYFFSLKKYSGDSTVIDANGTYHFTKYASLKDRNDWDLYWDDGQSVSDGAAQNKSGSWAHFALRPWVTNAGYNGTTHPYTNIDFPWYNTSRTPVNSGHILVPNGDAGAMSVIPASEGEVAYNGDDRHVYNFDGIAWRKLLNSTDATGGSGGGTTNASDLTTGTLPDARLSANVPHLTNGYVRDHSGDSVFVYGADTLTAPLSASLLPASVPLLDGDGNLPLTGNLIAGANGGNIDTSNGGFINTSNGGSIDTGNFGGGIDTSNGGGNINTDHSGGSIDISYSGGGVYTFFRGGDVNTSYDGGPINTTNSGGFINTSEHGGPIDTGNFGGAVVTSNGGAILTQEGGGSIQTNGYGSPIDNNVPGPIGSLYCDQDPAGASGHVLWVMEASGWVGK